MTAKLIVQSGDTEIVHQIDVPVLRIGRGGNCDIRIDGTDVDDHQLTLEYRDCQYIVHNRSDADIYIDSARVASGASHLLKDGQSLTFGNDVQIDLEVDGDPSPSPLAQNERYGWETQSSDNDEFDETDAYEDDESDDFEDEFDGTDLETSQIDRAGPDPKTIIQLVVTICCFVAIAAILVYKGGTTGESNDVKVPLLLYLLESSESDWEKRLVKEIQRAEASKLRGHSESARQSFFQLRDELEGKLPNAFVTDAKAFVMDRVWMLQDE